MADDSPPYAVLATATPYAGDRVTVRVDTVEMPDGSQATREVAVVDDAVAIVAVDEQRRVCLLDQYRHPFGERVLEIPAGKMDVDGESPLETARRELAEEAELSSEHWHELTCFLNSAGWSVERTHVLLAERVIECADEEFVATGEEAEMGVSMVPIDEALRMIDTGEIVDAKTILGVLLAARRIGITPST